MANANVNASTKQVENKVNANNVSKSITENAAKQQEISANAESLADRTLKEIKSGKAKKELSADEIAAKAAKKAKKAYNKVVNEIINGSKHKVLGVGNWLKQAKSVAESLDPDIAKAIESKWATLCVGVKTAGSFYAESIEKTDKNGKKFTDTNYHMVVWKDASNTLEIGRKITPTEYRFGFDEHIVKISSAKELTISRDVVEYDTIKEIFNGVEWQRRVAKKVNKTFRPVEILDLTPQEFAKRFKVAMQQTFPNNTFC